jgi:hypothetical protein
MTGSRWFRCARCGRHYPESYKVRQQGLEVCTFLPCYDDPGGQEQEEDSRVIRFTDPEEVLDVRR